MISFVKERCKWLANILIGEYSPYYIFQWNSTFGNAGPNIESGYTISPVDLADLQASDTKIHEQASYLGNESVAFGCFVEGSLVGVCFYWFRDRYKQRAFWPLRDGEAKLVQIVVTPSMRQRGVATELIRASATAMANQGFSNLYARIWHSNHASLRAFEKAGWQRSYFVFDFHLFGSEKRIRIQWKLPGHSHEKS